MTFICRSEEDIIDLIERFGKKCVKMMCLYSNIKYEIDLSDEYLLKYGFKKEILSVVRSHIKRGKMLIHINKTNGEVNKRFYLSSLYDTVADMRVEQLPENKAILMRLYDRLCYNKLQFYIKTYKRRFKGIDLETDPITFEPIVEPVYIKTDWDNNCKMVYSLDTIRKFKRFDLDDEPGVSPYTRIEFYNKDVKFVQMAVLDNTWQNRPVNLLEWRYIFREIQIP